MSNGPDSTGLALLLSAVMQVRWKRIEKPFASNNLNYCGCVTIYIILFMNNRCNNNSNTVATSEQWPFLLLLITIASRLGSIVRCLLCISLVESCELWWDLWPPDWLDGWWQSDGWYRKIESRGTNQSVREWRTFFFWSCIHHSWGFHVHSLGRIMSVLILLLFVVCRWHAARNLKRKEHWIRYNMPEGQVVAFLK